jgi:hypothetical protein
MKIRLVTAELFHAQTDGRTNRLDEANGGSSHFCKKRLKTQFPLQSKQTASPL